jgi:hypothetical protein
MAPMNLFSISSFSAKVGFNFEYQFDSNAFTDPNMDVITYTAFQSDGSPLPLWMNFTASTRTFSGNAPAS